MKAYICDHPPCQKRDETKQPYDLPPNGWFTLSPAQLNDRTKHFCSVDCLSAHVNTLIAAEAEPING